MFAIKYSKRYCVEQKISLCFAEGHTRRTLQGYAFQSLQGGTGGPFWDSEVKDDLS